MTFVTIKISHQNRNTYRSSDGVNPCWAWCVEHFGLPNGERWLWDTRRTFTFKHEQDAALFALRWT